MAYQDIKWLDSDEPRYSGDFNFADYECELNSEINDGWSNMTDQECQNYRIQDIIAFNHVFHFISIIIGRVMKCFFL